MSNLQKEGANGKENLKGPIGTLESGKLISTAIPGYNSEDFPADLESQWNDVVAYAWLLPSTFYQSGLLTSEQATAWLSKFEAKGEKFKVIS